MDTSEREVERVAAIPRSILLASAQESGPGWWQRLTQGKGPLDEQGVIRDEKLPFGIKVLAYHKNAQLRDAKQGEKNPATAGTGLRFLAVPAKASSGADAGGQVDMAAAYVQLMKKDGSSPLGTYLVSQVAAAQDIPERVTVDGKTFEMSLRFQQNYKPYSHHVARCSQGRLPGYQHATQLLVHCATGGPRPQRGPGSPHLDEQPAAVRGGDFLSERLRGPPSTPVETTTLQVVTNSGWMIPYVACMIVVFGMGAQFSQRPRAVSPPSDGSAAGRVAIPPRDGPEFFPSSLGRP